MSGEADHTVDVAAEKARVDNLGVFEIEVIDGAGVAYMLTLTVQFDGLRKLAANLLRRENGEMRIGDGAVRANIVRTGVVYSVDNPLAAVRPRYRDAEKGS